MARDGQNIPWQDFGGQDGEKLPDFDFNIPGEFFAEGRMMGVFAELFGENRVVRAGANIFGVISKNSPHSGHLTYASAGRTIVLPVM